MLLCLEGAGVACTVVATYSGCLVPWSWGVTLASSSSPWLVASSLSLRPPMGKEELVHPGLFYILPGRKATRAQEWPQLSFFQPFTSFFSHRL